MAATSNPTPPSEDAPSNSYASYLPHDLKYDAAFEDTLIQTILHTEGGQDGIRVIAEDSDEAPINGISVRARDVSPQSLPTIGEDELPLALDDPRRIFASPVPGVKLTHPGGYLEGGPGLDPDMDTFPDDFVSNNFEGAARLQGGERELQRAKQREIDAGIEQLKERLRARQKAKDTNERLQKELKTLTDQHDMELKIQQRMVEENRVKQEARERRRREREGD